MTFSPMKGVAYSVFDILFSTEIEVVNDALPFALDGRDGGVYEAADILEYRNAMVISGDGLTPADPTLTPMLEVLSPEVSTASALLAALQVTAANNTGAGLGADAAQFIGGDAVAAGGDAIVAVGGASSAGSDGGIGIDATGGDSDSGNGGFGSDIRGGTSTSFEGGIGALITGGTSGGTADGAIGAIIDASNGSTTGGGGVAIESRGGAGGASGGPGGIGFDVTGGNGLGAFAAGHAIDATGGAQVGGTADDGGTAVLGTGGTADLTLGSGGPGGDMTGGVGRFSGDGLVARGGDGVTAGDGVVASAGTGSTPSAAAGVFAQGEIDDGTMGTGGPGVFAFGGGSSSSSGSDLAGTGVIASGGAATDAADGGIGGLLAGGDSVNSEGGIGLVVGGGFGDTLDGVGILIEPNNATAIIAETDSVGTASGGLFIHSGAAAIERAAVVARATEGASALRLEADTSGGPDDGAHIYFADSVVDAGQFTTNGMMRFKNGSLTTTPITAFTDLFTTTLASTNGLVIRINGINYGFVMAALA